MVKPRFCVSLSTGVHLTPKKVTENRNMQQNACIGGYVRVRHSSRCAPCSLSFMIMNVEVERNGKTKILCQFVNWCPFEPNHNSPVLGTCPISRYFVCLSKFLTKVPAFTAYISLMVCLQTRCIATVTFPQCSASANTPIQPSIMEIQACSCSFRKDLVSFLLFIDSLFRS